MVKNSKTSSSEAVKLGLSGSAKRLYVFGLSHHQHDVQVRQKYVIDREGAERVSKSFNEIGVDSLVLSTCNRLEVVLVGGEVSSRQVVDVLEGECGEGLPVVGDGAYWLRDEEACRHLFRVACGLDSKLLGESQILGQLKRSYRESVEGGFCQHLLGRLVERAIFCAKRVRSRTSIGKFSLSMCVAAREAAIEIFGDLSQSRVLVLGAGEMAELFAKYFADTSVREVLIANRTLANAELVGERIAEEKLGGCFLLEDVAGVLPQVDIVIGSTARELSAPYVVSWEEVSAISRLREGRPIFFVDLGMPRNFPSALDDIDDVFCCDVDGLTEVVNDNLSRRETDVGLAEEIVEEGAKSFWKWFVGQHVEPVVSKLVRTCKAHARREELKTKRVLANSELGLTEDQMALIDERLHAHSEALIAKILHNPLTVLRDEEREELSSAVRKIFKV